MGVSVVFEDGSDTVEAVPGEQATCVLRVENTGMVVDRVLVDVLGKAAEWARVEPAQVNLLPGAVERVRVVFQPPRVASLAPGEVGFALRAMSSEDPEGSCIEEGSVRVGEFAELSAQLVPKSSTGRRSARFRLVVENRGNRPEQVRVETVDPEARLSFRTRPAVFVARPGTATFVRLKTAPRKTFFKGPNRTLPFEVSALPERGDAAKAEGVMLEKQTLPEWLLPLLGVGVVACGLLFALWITVLQPVVHSAASAAAQAQNAASSAKSAAKAMASPKPAPKSAPPTALAVNLASPAVVMGTTDLATVTGTFADGGGSVPALVWTSSAPRVAAVSQSGVVTAVSPGTATIMATSATSTASPAASAAASPRTTADPVPASPRVVSGSVTVSVVGSVSISTVSLPEAALGKAYAESLSGSGGTGSYRWSVGPGPLPPGLSLSAGTGAITGTPSTAAVTTFTVRLTDAGPPAQVVTRTVRLTVVDALAVDSSGLPGATTGTAYAQPLTAVGGTAPYRWSLVPGQGALPNGLNLDPATGAIKGTPATVGTFGIAVQVTDSAVPNQSATQHLSLVVAKPLVISTLTLPDGVTSTPYSQTLSASGGTEPYSWVVTAGSLPAGLTLGSTTGLIGGTPREDGSSTFTVRATDSGKPDLTAAQAFTVEVVTGFASTTSSLPQSAIGVHYTTRLTAAGGSAPYVWTLTGTLPSGLSLAPDGSIVGSPTTTGSFPFSVQATDSSAPPLTSTESLTLSVVGSLQITTAALPQILTGQPYAQTLTATGGTAPYTWSVTPGGLPDGLTLNPATGVISGIPVSTGTAQLTFSVADSGPPPQTASLTTKLVVIEPLTFSEPEPPEAAVGFRYAGATPTDVSGGSSGYDWSVTNGALPAGLQLAGSTGAITGTVLSSAAAGTYRFTLTVSDTADYAVTASTQLAITVVEPLNPPSVSVPSGSVGTVFDVPIQPTGGEAPYRISLVGAPSWMSLDPSTGELSGTLDGACTPAAADPGPSGATDPTMTITCGPDQVDGAQVTVTDALGESASTTLNPTVTIPPLVMTFNTAAHSQTGGTPLAAFNVMSEGPTGGYGGATYSYTAVGLPCDPADTSQCDLIDASSGTVTGDIGQLPGNKTDVTVTVTSTDPLSSADTVTATFHESITTHPAPAPRPSPSPSPSATGGSA